MDKYFILIFIFVLSEKIFTQETGSSLLWEISRNDISQKSYMFGTHHLFKSDFVDTSEVINKIIDNVSTIILEIGDYTIDTSFMIASMKMKENQYYTFPVAGDEDTLKNYLRKHSGFERIADFYFNIKPMAIWFMLFQSKYLDMNSNSDGSSKVLDLYFYDLALKNDKKIVGLETVNEQLIYFLTAFP